MAALTGLPLIFATCGAPTIPTAESPAGPPAPPVELPSPIVLKFVAPEDLTIDLSSISGDEEAYPNIMKAVGDYIELDITLGPIVANNIYTTYFRPSLYVFTLIEMPVGVDIHTFETTIDIPASADLGYLSLLVGPHNVKIDFADYDLDSVNGTEGCSGNTAELPVCARVWLDNQRYLAWVFDTFPYEAGDPNAPGGLATTGNGRFRYYVEGIPDEGMIIGDIYVSLASLYSEQVTEPRTKHLEHFILAPQIEEGDDVREWRFHIVEDQQGPEETALKLINLNLLRDYVKPNAENNDYDILKYIGRFVEGGDYWSGSNGGETYYMSGDPVIGATYNLCGYIPTFTEVETLNCDNAGISVGNMEFVRAATAADAVLPEDFPLTPTF